MNSRLLFIFIFFFSLNAAASTLQVCPDCRFHSISDAILASHSGDTVLVKRGVYNEGQITIDKSIALVGGRGSVVEASKGEHAIVVESDSVVISGLTIRNVSTSFLDDLSAIRVNKSAYVKVLDNRMENNFFAVYVAHSHHCIIMGNTIVGNAKEEASSGNGIHLWYCHDMQIHNNEVQEHRDGIYLEFVDSSSIGGNVVTDNLRYGLHFMFSNYDEYFGNTFERSGAGVAVMFSRYIEMCRNKFVKNWGSASYGLLLKEIYDGIIIENEFIKNTSGIHAEGATRIRFERNTFTRNGWAVNMKGSCMDNVLTRNIFSSNSFDFATGNSRLNNSIDGNYWSEYTGYDLDKDGIGDVPHRPVKLFSYVIDKVPEAVVLHRSLFIELMGHSERVAPVFTPKLVVDHSPLMRRENVKN